MVRLYLSRWLLALTLVGGWLVPAFAAPTIANLSPRGLRIGQPTTLVITGSDLSPDSRLLLPAKIASQAIKGEAKADRLEIEVTLDAAAQPGLIPLRVANAHGISAPIVIGVDSLPQTAFTDQLTELPVALHGAVGGAQVLRTKIAGKKDQRIVLDVEAQRLGASLKPVVRLYDPRGKQIAWSPPRPALGGDARCQAILPADAEYTIELHDQLFRTAGPGHFRLKVGDLSYADFALPLAVAAGSKQTLKFAGSNLTATAEHDASAASVPGQSVATVPSTPQYTGAAPRLEISDHAELVEAPAQGALQELSTAPVGISGVLAAKGEEDKYLLPVTPGQKLHIDVVARQLGSPLDGVLSIRNEQGSQLAAGDDRPNSSDPLVDFDVPADVNKLQVALKDLNGEGGADHVYRLEITDRTRPQIELTLPSPSIVVPAGGTQVVPVQVTRTNYGGPIELSLEGAPSELTLAGNVIPPGATIGLLTLSATQSGPQAVLSRVVGKALESPVPLVRLARFGDAPGSRYQPALREQVGLAIAAASPIGIAWNARQDDKLVLGGKLAARLSLPRREGAMGSVRIRLLTTQPMPRKKIKENNQDKEVDDLDRALRLEGDPVFPADQKEVSVNILVPADLPQQPWDLVLAADLLSADGKSAVASIATPVRRLTTSVPFTIELAGASTVEGKAGAGETGKFTGKVARSAGFTQPVVVTLESLPKGYSSPTVLVQPEQTDFALPVTFAFGSKPGELKGVKLVAVAAPVSTTSVKSNAIDVVVNVVPGEKPAAEQPKEIFEDDEKFVALLTEGDGRAIPDQRDKYSGTYSLRVTPGQRFNASLPSLGVNIRENPGPGEYRYIRFAWKKAGGNTICLQLNHDGTWGPGGTGREGAKFRYHAGPGGECYGASLVISDKLPAPKFEVVTRDLFADFGEFTLTGLAFSPVDGNAALFDHIYLGRQMEDFELLKVEKK
ncbi:MAG: hypothetical protein L0211_14380 [Planctomycetaceae bacterium]|nr:hypothetical protein [Planctomycetaceae bacterium]